MRKCKIIFMFAMISFVMIFGMFYTEAYAKDSSITSGITIGDIDVSGMTQEEAKQKVDEYITGFTSKIFTLNMDDNKVDVNAGELGYHWENTGIVEEAAAYCKEGNVISRYKESKDIAKEGIKYEIKVAVDDEILTNTINEKCGVYNIPHKNASLKRVGNSFEISSESSGRMIEIETTVNELHSYLLDEWDGNNAEFTLTVVDDEPTSRVADCEKVKDLIGTYSTTFSTGSGNYNRNKNMENGVNLLDGITVAMGETISVNSYLEPWTSDNGWYMAGTYVNGRTEDSLGGGICQVSSTLYNALLMAETEIVERYPHSMTVGYVPLSQDAALAGTWKDLKFRNNTDTPLYVEGIYTNGRITFNIYGVETRPSNRRIEYKHEVVSTIPAPEIVKEDPSLPAGYRVVTSGGHTGYKTRLKKLVYIDNVLQSEEVINSSTYKASNSYVTVGTGAAAPTPTPQQEKPSETQKPTQEQPVQKPPVDNPPAQKPENNAPSASEPNEDIPQEPSAGENEAPTGSAGEGNSGEDDNGEQ